MIRAVSVLALALGGGIGSAWLAAGSLAALPSAAGWHALPGPSPLAANPYRRALAGPRFTPGGAQEERLLLASLRSEDGRPLERRCAYRVAGRMPPAHAWTLSAADESLDPSRAGAAGLTSAGVVWEGDGTVAVTIGAEPVSGNWIPLVPGPGNFVLMIGLYDARVGVGGSAADLQLPPVTRLACRDEAP